MLEALADYPALIALLIFLARVADVSLGTFRTILVFRGHKYASAAIGFVEILIWVFAVSSVIQNLDQWYFGVAYAGGFAVGNIAGITLEKKIAMGTELVRAVSIDASIELAARLRKEGFDVIELRGRGNGSEVEVLLIVEKRRRVPRLLQLIDATDPDAIYTVTDVKDTMSPYRGTVPARRIFPPRTKKK